MPDNRKNQSNVATILPDNGPVDKIQEGISRMEIIEKKENGVGERTEYPDRPGEPDCLYYLRTGLCGYGTNCRFNHPPILHSKTAQDTTSELPQREGQPDCGYYLKTGTCKYGSSCKYHHPTDRRDAGQVALNTLGLPIRQEEKPCPYYMRTYACKFGPACKFDHPQPAPFEATLPAPAPAALGTKGSRFLSTGIPYVHTFPAWSLPRSSYVASSCVPSPQTYMPLVLPPLQTPFAAQNWNNYMGNLSSTSAADMLAQNYVYNPKSQGEVVTGGPLDLLTQGISDLPKRPDQPECRYFLSNGSCKYGSNCKFNHPKEKFAHSLGPHGLPFRPGEDLCVHFSSHGGCKYGATCKFDHPIYFTSYYLGMPSIPMVDLPLLNSTRNMVIPNSCEASQSKSSNITDWIQKPDSIQEKKRKSSVSIKSVDPLREEAHDDQPGISTAAAVPTSELPPDQSE